MPRLHDGAPIVVDELPKCSCEGCENDAAGVLTIINEGGMRRVPLCLEHRDHVMFLLELSEALASSSSDEIGSVATQVM